MQACAPEFSVTFNERTVIHMSSAQLREFEHLIAENDGDMVNDVDGYMRTVNIESDIEVIDNKKPYSGFKFRKVNGRLALRPIVLFTVQLGKCPNLEDLNRYEVKDSPEFYLDEDTGFLDCVFYHEKYERIMRSLIVTNFNRIDQVEMFIAKETQRIGLLRFLEGLDHVSPVLTSWEKTRIRSLK